MENYKKGFNYCLNLLAKRRYSKLELKKKLKSRKLLSEETIGKILEKLEMLHFIDDNFFTEAYIDSQLRKKPQGKKLLEYHLKQKGISEDMIQKKFTEMDIDEEVLAQDLIKRKFRLIKNPSLDQQNQKIYRFLLSRGFSPQTIYNVIKIGDWGGDENNL